MTLLELESTPPKRERVPLPLSELDLGLTAQLTVAWVGEGGEEPRLKWWRTDMVSEFDGENLFRRLLPHTWEWAVLQAAREAARRKDAELRAKDQNPDQILSLFSLGSALDERLEERLQDIKRSGRLPQEALPGLDREPVPIADAVAQRFPQLAGQLRSVQARLDRLPGSPRGPAAFAKLSDALEQCIRTCRQTKPTVKLVKKYLDALRDGVQLLQLYDAELTDAAIRAVTDAHEVLVYQAKQIEELGGSASNVIDAAARVRQQLSSERPWQAISGLAEDLEQIRVAYTSERKRLLQWQEQEAEAARARVKARDGFSTLTGEQSHQVLRPFTRAVTDTTAEAIAPPLSALSEPFSLALSRAEDQANDILDEILSAGDKPLIARVHLDLRNRELVSEADVDALVDEIRKRLMEQIRAGARVRLT